MSSKQKRNEAVQYNGWSNFETWNFNLWITNEESDHSHALEMAFDSEHEYELSEKLEEWANDMADDVLSSYEYAHGFIADMVNSSVKEVNFYEVAEHLWEERQEAIKEHDGEEE